MLEVFGRFHPLLLHLPIGLIVGLLALEAVGRLRRRPLSADSVSVLVWLAALSAVVVASSGWMLGSETDYSGDTLLYHRWLGVSVASVALLTAFAHAASGRRPGARKPYLVLLCANAVLLVLAGHYGSTLTHGAGFLTEPLRPREARPVPAVPVELPLTAPDEMGSPDPLASAGPAWSTHIAPILEANCTRCHGASKRKGGLALHTPAALLRGAKEGPVLVLGYPDQSELIRRLLLPLEDDDHMPPEGKPQPSPAEIEALRAWVAAGAPFDVPTDAPEVEIVEQDLDAGDEDLGAPTPVLPPQPDAQALAVLQAELVHVETLPGESGGLWIDFAATAENVDDQAARRLLEPLAAHVVELSLARSRIGDGTAQLLADFPRLRRLDLRSSAVTDAGVAALARCTLLEELVLAQTTVGDEAVTALLEMPALRQVWLWKSSVSADGLARLLRERPELRVDDGATPDAAVLEAEAELQFTSDRPLPGQEPQQDSALVPVNTVCPVSGDPVNPKYAVVHAGRVIGFCCPNCPKEFWADPEAFAVKLR